mmetsp:Transcript_18552/g.56001  ORF Transcript_18552/g.56001 Transcript_18552/m.56001 type:complete len:203 (+) Transcript_18552:2406-3014(+)
MWRGGGGFRALGRGCSALAPPGRCATPAGVPRPRPRPPKWLSAGCSGFARWVSDDAAAAAAVAADAVVMGGPADCTSPPPPPPPTAVTSGVPAAEGVADSCCSGSSLMEDGSYAERSKPCCLQKLQNHFSLSSGGSASGGLKQYRCLAPIHPVCWSMSLLSHCSSRDAPPLSPHSSQATMSSSPAQLGSCAATTSVTTASSP